MFLAAEKATVDIRLPKRVENTGLVVDQIIEIQDKEGIEYDNRHSLSSLQRQSGTTPDTVIPPWDVHKMMGVRLLKALKKLGAWVIDFAIRKVICALETCSVDHNLAFAKKSALHCP